MMQIFAYFSILSIIISCLGLYALVTFSLEQRVKEIGIRKVLGAGLPDIFMVIGKDFLLLVGLASLLAFPVAGYGLYHWLQDFANRISLEWWMFAGSLVAVFLVAILTLISRILPAASANPVVSLRTE
jgi:putative ABC transport system permease protein